MAQLDADPIVRLLSGDDAEKAERVAVLLERAERGELQLTALDTTIFDVFVVLTSPRLYAMPPALAAVALATLLQNPGLRVENRATLLRAIDLAPTMGSLGDAMIVAAMEREGTTEVYSWDRGFDRVAWITRLEP